MTHSAATYMRQYVMNIYWCFIPLWFSSEVCLEGSRRFPGWIWRTTQEWECPPHWPCIISQLCTLIVLSRAICWIQSIPLKSMEFTWDRKKKTGPHYLKSSFSDRLHVIWLSLPVSPVAPEFMSNGQVGKICKTIQQIKSLGYKERQAGTHLLSKDDTVALFFGSFCCISVRAFEDGLIMGYESSLNVIEFTVTPHCMSIKSNCISIAAKVI